MLPFLLLCSAFATDWTLALGAQADQDSHGIATVIAQDGPWTYGYYTDTLEVRVAPDLEGGRAWAALRTEAGLAGLLASPWEDGAPAPEQALVAGYISSEGGAVRYLRGGLWWGGQMSAQAWWFLPTQATTIEVPTWQPYGRAEWIGGWWSEPAAIDIRAGADAQPDGLSPHVSARMRWAPAWTVRPNVNVQVGWAHAQDLVTLTRLGGLTPYAVPLAGAAWAEFRVEDYAAVQLGPELSVKTLDFALLADVAHFQSRTELGFSPRARWHARSVSLDLAVGYAPKLVRQQGSAISVYTLFSWHST